MGHAALLRWLDSCISSRKSYRNCFICLCFGSCCGTRHFFAGSPSACQNLGPSKSTGIYDSYRICHAGGDSIKLFFIFQDGFGLSWDHQLIATIVEEEIRTCGIDLVRSILFS